jgi:hypothetical protein
MNPPGLSDPGDMGPQQPTGEGAPPESMMPGHSVASAINDRSVDPRLIDALANSGNGMAAMGGAMRNKYEDYRAKK